MSNVDRQTEFPGKQTRNIFVIMPFTSTLSRDDKDLTEFFDTNLKGRIESQSDLRYRYVVKRSADAFDINAEIIRCPSPIFHPTA